MIPYGRQWIEPEDLERVLEVFRSDWITQGPAVERFEEALCARFGARYAVAVSSGTAALHLACLALGVGAGDRVVTSPNTFVASANCVLYCGGTVCFVDIEPETGNLCVERLEAFLENAGNREGLKGIIPVHFAGQPCDLGRIRTLADRYDLWVLEDACHAPGARWRGGDGQWHAVGSCSHSDAAVLSFHPVKHVTTGEGGAILTNRKEIYSKIQKLRSHGITRDRKAMETDDGPWFYEMEDLGFNYRITDFQCALGISQLQRLDEVLKKRREIAEMYGQALGGLPGVRPLAVRRGVEHAYHLYVVRLRNRRAVFEELSAAGIGVQVHYIPVHLQPYYRRTQKTGPGDFPEAEAHYREALSLPIFYGLGNDGVGEVLQALRRALGTTDGIR